MRRILNEVARMKKIAGIISENQMEGAEVNKAQGMSPIDIDAIIPISKLNTSQATAEEFEAAIPLLQKIGIQVEPQPERNPGEKEWLVKYKGNEDLYVYSNGQWFGEYGGYADDE